MSTTDLLVEYLVIGAVADIWLVLLVFALIPLDSATLTLITDLVGEFAALLIVPFLAVTYVLGGVIDFAASRLFGRSRTRYREELFGQVGKTYYQASGLLYQQANETVTSRIRGDAHIIRVARSSVLTFSLLALTVLLFLKAYMIEAVIGSAICVGVVSLSFGLYKNRYRSMYGRMLSAYRLLCTESKDDKAYENQEQNTD